MDAMEQKVIGGRFEVQEELGRGGMGVVFLVREAGRDDPIALKLLDTRRFSEATLHHFEQEFRLLTGLTHPNLTEVYDFGRHRLDDGNEAPFFTMEYIQGKTLDQYVRGVRHETGTLCRILAQVALALGYLHDRNLVHQDVKPGNILVSGDGESPQVHLMDLGLAGRPAMGGTPGMIHGTVAYLSPEAAGGGRIDARSDLYSLGCVAYEMVTGQPPFLGSSSLGVLRGHMMDEPAPLSKLAPGIPARLERMVLKLLSKDPGLRYPGVRGLLEELQKVAGPEIEIETPDTRRQSVLGAGFTGRRNELARLHRWMKSAAGGEGRLILVEGESGIGKSRLLREFQVRCQLDGYGAFLGRPDDLAGGGGILTTLSQAIRAGRPLPATVREEHAAFLAALESTDSENLDRNRLFSGAAEILRERSSQGPLVLAVEDLHQADQAACGLLLHLVECVRGERGMNRTPGLPVLLIATYRGDQVSRSSPMFPLLADRGPGSGIEEIVLGPLSLEESRTMVRAMTGTEKESSEFVQRLHDETQGNPLHLEELIALLAEEGVLDPGTGTLPEPAVLDDLSIPAKIHNLLERRVARLEEEALLVLRTLAVFGTGAVGAETVSAVSNLRWEPVTRWLMELTRAGVVHQEYTRDEQEPLYRPARAALGELALSGMPEQEKAGLHRSVVSYLERRGVPRNHNAWAAFALQAESAGLPGRAITAWSQAGNLAEELYAHAEAEGFYGRAIDLARTDASSSVNLLCGLFERRGKTRQQAGNLTGAEEDARWMLARAEKGEDAAQRARAHLFLGKLFRARSSYSQAQENLELAQEIAEGIPDPVVQVESMIESGRIFGALEDQERGSDLLEEARALARENGMGGAEIQALLAVGKLRGSSGNYQDSLEAFQEAKRLASEEEYPGADLAIQEGTAMALEMQGEYGRAITALENAGTQAATQGDAGSLARISARLGALHIHNGAFGAAEQVLDKALTLHRRLGSVHGILETLVSRGELSLHRGRYPEAMEAAEEALEIARRWNRKESMASALLLSSAIELQAGDPERAERALEEAGADLAESPNRIRRAGFLLHTGDLHTRRSRFPDARKAYQETAFLARRTGDARMEARAMIRLAECCLQEQEFDRAAVAIKKIRKLAAGLGISRIEADFWMLKARMELYRPGGDLVQAEIDAVNAVERFRSIGDTEKLWRAELLAGKAAVRLGKAGEGRQRVERAHRYLEKVRTRLSGRWLESFLESPDRKELYDEIGKLSADRSGAGSGEGSDPDRRSHSGTGSASSEARKENESLRRLLDINKNLNSAGNLDELLRMILNAACELTGAERGFLLLHDGQELTTRDARGRGDTGLEGQELEMSRSIAVKVIETGEPLLSTNLENDRRFRGSESIHALQIRSVLAVPLRIRDQVAGAIYLDNRLTRHLFEPRHLELTSMLADQAGIALGTSKMLARIEEQADHLERMNQELEKTLDTQQEELESVREELFSSRSSFELRYRFEDMIGVSPAMQMVYHMIERLAPKKLPVLITGESGTGKELIARAIHARSPRKESAFFTVNCAALTESLLESELFGHRKGAFTGADRNKPGYFELADGGTLFLDEIGETGPAMQAKLLRAIERGEVLPVGGKAVVSVDVRIVSATHQNLKELIQDGQFREDLYYRINVGRIEIPALRERKEDIPLLADHFLSVLADEEGEPRKEFEPAALRRMLGYPWPGNVRELQHQILRVAAFARKPKITLKELIRFSDLPAGPARGGQAASAPDAPTGTESLEEMEKKQILRAMEEAGGNKTRAAEILGINRATLFRKIKRFELKL